MSRRAAGIALLSVLLIVAVATALAYRVATRHALSLAHTRQTLEGSLARQYAFGGEEYARQLLYEDWEDEDRRSKDTFLEAWAGIVPEEKDTAPWGRVGQAEHEPSASRTRAPVGRSQAFVFEVDSGNLAIRIDDLSARFNLNAVAGPDGAQNLARLKRLLTGLGIDPNAADVWRDWIDADQDVQGFGAEDADALLREPPRRTSNQRAIDASEFAVATRLDAAQFALLRLHVAALPMNALRVNVNTATAAVLSALAPNFESIEAQSLLEGERDFDDVESVVATYATLGESVAVLAVGSEFFRVQVRAEIADSRAELTSMIHRNSNSGALTVLARSFGSRFESEPRPDSDSDA